MRTAGIATTKILGGVVLSLFLAGPTIAADMRAPVKAPPRAAATAVYNWSGLYIGAHVGYARGDSDWFYVTPPLLGFYDGEHRHSGLLGGGQIGYNFQSGVWVFGVEVDASKTGIRGDGVCRTITGPFSCESDVNWMATATARLGFASNNVLIYVKGGGAYAAFDYNISGGGFGTFATADDRRWGWTVGGGIELGLGSNWSVKGEYNYIRFRDRDETFNCPTCGLTVFDINIGNDLHVGKIGLNYRFGGGPVVARY